MNTLLTIAAVLAGSAVLQFVCFYGYSSYHKRKLLKSMSLLQSETIAASLNKQPSGKNHNTGAKAGGKIAALHASHKPHSVPNRPLQTSTITTSTKVYTKQATAK